MRDPREFDRMDEMMARFDRELRHPYETVIRLERPIWPTSVRELQADIRTLKRDARNDLKPSKTVAKRRAAQKAQCIARRRNRHG